MTRTNPHRCIVCYRPRHFCPHSFPQGAFCEIEYQQPFSARHTTTHWQEVHTNEVVEFLRAERLRMQLDLAIYGRAEVPSPEEGMRRFKVRVGDKTVGHVKSFQPSGEKLYPKAFDLKLHTYHPYGAAKEDPAAKKKGMGPGIANLRAVEKLDLLHDVQKNKPEDVPAILEAMGAKYVDDYWVLPADLFHQGNFSMSVADPADKGALLSGAESTTKTDLSALVEMVKKHKAPTHVLDYGDSEEWPHETMNDFRGDVRVPVKKQPMVDMEALTRGYYKK